MHIQIKRMDCDMSLPDIFNPSKPYCCPRMHPNPLVCPCASCDMARKSAASKTALKRAIAKEFAPTGSLMPVKQTITEDVVPKETTREKIERQRRERFKESEMNWQEVQASEARHSAHREKIIAERKAAQQAYGFTEKEWNDDLQKQAKEYRWETAQQENVSIAILTVEEANEYLDLLIKDTHGQLSTGKDYTGIGMGLKGAYEVAKELGGWGATAKAVNINGVMNIVVENYKPRYLDLSIRWQEATPQMLKIGHALNTVQGNISFLRGNIFVEVVFSGAVNAVDYMLHDVKTLGEVVGQFTADISKGIVAGVIAQGITILGVATLSTVFIVPTALTLGIFAVSAFIVGNEISKLDDQFKFTEPMKNQVEKTIDDF